MILTGTAVMPLINKGAFSRFPLRQQPSISVSSYLKPVCTGNFTRGQYEEKIHSHLLDRKWALSSPDTKIHEIVVARAREGLGDISSGLVSFSANLHPSLGEEFKEAKQLDSSFYVIRDDLLHPLMSGNKLRKLDALLPLIEAHLVTDVVTCGGCQSAHAAALAVACAERGMQSHLLLRGEKPEVLTGYNLISMMYGNVVYVPRSIYANRETMLARHADLVAGHTGSVMWLHNEVNMQFKNESMPMENHVSQQHHGDQQLAGIVAQATHKKVAVVKEGGSDAIALLGLIRLVDYLAQPSVFGRERALQFVVDSGTGTTAVGLALGALLYGLPWKVIGVMLADTVEGYKKHEARLLSDFKKLFSINDKYNIDLNEESRDHVQWIKRHVPRKFGNVYKGELDQCKQIAQETGILVDPIYTLASWEHATLICQNSTRSNVSVVMLHTGGTLGLFGLAQRYKSYFDSFKGAI